MESLYSDTIATFSVGIVLGLSAGLSPGPLLALVIAQTLKHGVGEGMKVALAPLITDLPIVLAATFLLKQLSNTQSVLGFISLIGGLFVAETLSVIIQIFWFKLFKRRVFKMAPIHHHFELLGWPEIRVIIRFWLVCAIFAATGFFIYYLKFID